MIGHIDNYSESWKELGWKKFRKNLFRLQCRLWKAVKAGDMRKARNLQKLILKSQSAIFLAIRQVTQLNNGKKTAGIDGKANLNFKQRFELANLLKAEAFKWKHQKLREIPIPKKNGTTRMLKIPTIHDRAWQKLVHYALEPAHEATFHARSYGFRTGRSAHDAQKMLFLNLSKSANGTNKRILELDLEKCFDRIRHSQIMEKIILPQSVKTGIWRCLKKGTNPQFPEQGTPQGGCISPTLANIALNGIEKIHNIIRYADDVRHLTRC
jgi:RNA-directed DNA polymerase